MSEMRQQLLARRMKWAGRLIGLVAAGFFLVFLVGEAISEVLDEGREPLETAGILLGLLQGLALVGAIVS